MDWVSILDNSLSAAIRPNAIIFALAAIGLNVHFGYTGLLNFGQVGFMAVGGYFAAISVLEWGVPLWLGWIIGLLASAVWALLLGYPTLRLRADYLAIVTIAASEIFRLSVMAPSFREVTGGADGLSGFDEDWESLNPLPSGRYGIGFLKFSADETWAMLLGWTLVLLAVLFVWLLIRSPWGRVLKAIREDEDAVRALGKNVFAYKMQSLVIGGALGALAGIYFVSNQGSVVPSNYSTAQTFYAYVCLILGGTARIWGPVVGSMLFWGIITFTDSALRQAVDADIIPQSLMDPNQVGQVRLMLVGLGLILLLVYRPQGLLGDRRELMLEPK
jgi:branched-chain amino acid transport system permease protein